MDQLTMKLDKKKLWCASLALGVTLCGCNLETGAERQARQLREIAALPRYQGPVKWQRPLTQEEVWREDEEREERQARESTEPTRAPEPNWR